VLPTSYANLEHGETHGLEVSANLRIVNRWSISTGYSFLTAHIHRDPLSQDLTTPAATEGGSPQHQAQLRSHLNLPGHWEWNASAYFVGRLSAQAVPSFTRLDTNFAKQLTEGFTIALVGENLLNDHHLESNNVLLTPTPSQVKRSVYAKMTWQF
jgi:outer membrane receptor protein involved in Fe transport